MYSLCRVIKLTWPMKLLCAVYLLSSAGVEKLLNRSGHVGGKMLVVVIVTNFTHVHFCFRLACVQWTLCELLQWQPVRERERRERDIFCQVPGSNRKYFHLEGVKQRGKSRDEENVRQIEMCLWESVEESRWWSEWNRDRRKDFGELYPSGEE